MENGLLPLNLNPGVNYWACKAANIRISPPPPPPPPPFTFRPVLSGLFLLSNYRHEDDLFFLPHHFSCKAIRHFAGLAGKREKSLNDGAAYAIDRKKNC